eukprot:TRINITY_DN26122_c0_g1_i3.p1 TRINITY_DN26122_c0_g1~~TRINITY_DN26122_c0_g1_i3.p1  ORF type:complete len:176 (+),score=21.90 TRINITY_DN26122_c0_g1_i3:65-592(+)
MPACHGDEAMSVARFVLTRGESPVPSPTARWIRASKDPLNRTEEERLLGWPSLDVASMKVLPRSEAALDLMERAQRQHLLLRGPPADSEGFYGSVQWPGERFLASWSRTDETSCSCMLLWVLALMLLVVGAVLLWPLLALPLSAVLERACRGQALRGGGPSLAGVGAGGNSSVAT